MLKGTGRAVEEIDEILTAAKLDRKDLFPVSQEIIFDDNFSGTEYRLVELDKVVAESIRQGSRLVFRGEPNDSAVFCTEDATYEVKDTETSNSLLVLEDLSFPEQARRTSGSTNSSGSSASPDSLSSVPVISFDSTNCTKPGDHGEAKDDDILETVVRPIKYIAHSYFELKKINPNLSKIRRLLFPSKYKGENAESDSEDIMTLDDLLDKVPASVKEIEGYLEAIRAIKLNGFIRLIDEDYLFRVLSHVISCIDENSWSNENIQKKELIKTLSETEPEFILQKVCDWFFTPSPASSDGDTLCYNEQEVCRFMGETLLKPVDRFNLREFVKVWQESVPEGLKVGMKQLEGIAVTNVQSSPACIWHFPEYNLPENTTDRFSVLFETKPKWKLEEITPFLQNLSSSSQTVGVLLTKHSRVTNVNGIKYYSSKHLK